MQTRILEYALIYLSFLCGPLRISAFSALKKMTQRAQRYAEGRREKSELETQSHLSFTPGQHLYHGVEWTVRNVRHLLNCRRVLSIEYIEKLEQRVQPYTLGDIEFLRESQIEIDERGTGERIASWSMIDGIKRSISIRILLRAQLAKVITTLRSEKAAHLKLPRKLQQPVELKRVVH